MRNFTSDYGMLVLRNDPNLSKFLKKVENSVISKKMAQKQREQKNKICLAIIDGQNSQLLFSVYYI